MARMARIVAPGFPHHVTQRGNDRRNIFLNKEDRMAYLALIRKYAEKYGVSLITYCLMDNHIHFIAIPENSNSLARAFQISHMLYAKSFNEKHGFTGHMWHCRFYSCTLSEAHLIQAARYVERNPVRAGLVDKPWEWKWSSAAFHTGATNSDIPLGNLFDHIDQSPQLWKDFIDGTEDCLFQSLIKEHTRTGRPAGLEQFISELEIKTGKSIRPCPRGRPPKKIVNCPQFP